MRGRLTEEEMTEETVVENIKAEVVEILRTGNSAMESIQDGDTFIPSPEAHNCEYALAGCKGFSEGRRVRSAYGRDAWACSACAAKLDRYRPFQRLTSIEATEAN
jgi:hypothetical protein